MTKKAREAATEEAPARRSGRPTKQASELLTETIVEVATRLFCSASYESTSVDQIVAEARISKQTFYARFPSKEAVFAAVTRRGADDLLKPITTGSYKSKPTRTKLIEFGVQSLKRALAPQSLSLHRLIYAEAQRYPEMARAFHDNSFQRTSDILSEVFLGGIKVGEIRHGDPRFMARQYSRAVVDGPMHEAMMNGVAFGSDDELRAHVTSAVDLLLEGCAAPDLGRHTVLRRSRSGAVT